jgi:hypothetical protein
MLLRQGQDRLRGILELFYLTVIDVLDSRAQEVQCGATMFTATTDLILPSTTTGSFPRPRWFDVSMWGRPLDTCMLDVRFREKFQDAMTV